jgi:hypothetical protein
VARRWAETDELVLWLTVACYLVVLVGWLIGTRHGNQYSALAEAIWHGRLDVRGVDGSDVTVWGGRTFLPVPFLPALILLPLVAVFGPGTYESVVCAAVGIVNLLLFRRLLDRWMCPTQCRPWLLLLFGLGSLHFAAVAGGGNWLFSHVVVTGVLLLLLLEAFGRNRPWLLGLLIGVASLARPSTLFLLPFPLLVAWALGKDRRQVARHALLVGVGLLPIVGIWLWYNWARFGDPLQDGYAAITVPPCLAAAIDAHGLHSIAFVPRNLFLLLLSPPSPIPGDGAVIRRWGDVGPIGCTSLPGMNWAAPSLAFPFFRPSEWGMGLLVTTPAVVWAFAASWRDRWVRLGWLTIASSLAITLTYASPGWIQFGARYTLDFMPFLLLLIVRSLPHAPPRVFKVLVVISVMIECWGIVLTVLARTVIRV